MNMQITPPNDTDLTPIVVVVANGRWDAYGEPTPRTQYLYNMLVALGGINESVPDGTHHFNVLDVGGVPVASLTPAPPAL